MIVKRKKNILIIVASFILICLLASNFGEIKKKKRKIKIKSKK